MLPNPSVDVAGVGRHNLLCGLVRGLQASYLGVLRLLADDRRPLVLHLSSLHPGLTAVEPLLMEETRQTKTPDQVAARATRMAPTVTFVVVRGQDHRDQVVPLARPIIVKSHPAGIYMSMAMFPNTTAIDIMGRGRVAPRTIVRPAPLAIARPHARAVL